MRIFLNITLILALTGAIASLAYKNRLNAYPLTALTRAARPTKPKPSQLAGIFAEIQKGLLVPNQIGIVNLTGKTALLTKDHRAYVTQKPGHLLAVLFPTWIGKGSNLEGYLYCNRTLNQSDIAKDYYGKNVITLNTPGAWSKQVPATPQELAIDRQVGRTTYLVSRSLD